MAPTASNSSARSSNGISDGAAITDEDLLNLGVKDLNRLLKTLTPDERSKLKKRRRILKNRGYAANCRTKRMSFKEILELEKTELEKDVKKMKHDNDIMRIKLESIKERFKDMEHYVNVLKSKKENK